MRVKGTVAVVLDPAVRASEDVATRTERRLLTSRVPFDGWVDALLTSEEKCLYNKVTPRLN